MKVNYLSKDYAVLKLINANIKPIVIDLQDLKFINDMNQKWKANDEGNIYCTYVSNNCSVDLFLHEVIMGLKTNKNLQKKSILHINRINSDNRRDNLMYDCISKETNKNMKKKKRTVELPKNSDINPDEIPTYIWYDRANDQHGDRFNIEISDIRWQSTSSNEFSLKYKLEQAKAYLRNLKETYPDLFDEYCMNGEYTKHGKELLDSYYEIVKLAGFKIKKEEMDNITDAYLAPDTDSLTDKYEKMFFNFHTGTIINNNFKSDKLHKIAQYVYYKPATNKYGDFFVINGQPNQKGNIWISSKSKSVSTTKKFIDMVKYLKYLQK